MWILPFIVFFLFTGSAVSGREGESSKSGVSREPAPQFVGSQRCAAACHPKIYATWRSTRHSYSVLTANEARRAGFPLPAGREVGEKPAIRSWKDVSYVLGGRQRITYVDKKGQVRVTSYHHRIGKWNRFPTKRLSDCGGCHFTGFGAGPPHPDDPALSGRWVERGIGCEACHGPGRRHMDTYSKRDVVVDVSPRACGRCHTAISRVLPKDDSHATHDLVQVWNHDRHATSVRFNSHSAFCSRCHSPYEGQFLDSTQAAKRRVFAEDKHNVTCIACHNPHDLTHGDYTRQRVSLEPPLPPKRQVYHGHDEDFTTSDYGQFETTEKVCVQCHRGADRIDLDHANATCNDCHNTFARNRSLESRVFQDANHSKLSCRPCHQDADHLMMILFRDPDFLEPKHIHNLRTLPERAQEKYQFRYPGLSRTVAMNSSVGTREGLQSRELASRSSRVRTDKSPRQRASSLKKQLRTLLAGEVHRRLAADETVRALQDALRDRPQSMTGYLDLAKAYSQGEAFRAARDLVQYTMRLDNPWILLELPLDEEPRVSLEEKTTDANGRSLEEQLLPSERIPDAEIHRLWIRGYQQMSQARFAEAAETLGVSLRLDESGTLGCYLGLAELGQGRHEAAVKTLEAVLEDKPDHLTSRLALGVAHLKQGQFGKARSALEQAVAGHPHDPVANYLLGRAYLRQRDPAKAAKVLQSAAAQDPTFLEAWFALARAYRLDRDPAAAAEAYYRIIEADPGQFHAHFELAGLYKQLSDKMAFQLRGDRESRVPAGTSAQEWREHLATLDEELRAYAQLALSEFGTTLRIRPFDFEAIRQVSEIYRRSGRLAEGLEMFQWLSRRRANQWMYYYRQGTILFQLRRYEEAIQVLKRAWDVAPAEGDVYLALGLAYVESGRLSEAIDTFTKGTTSTSRSTRLSTRISAPPMPAVETTQRRARRCVAPWSWIRFLCPVSTCRIRTWGCCT